MARHQSSNGTGTTRPPRRSIASSFVCGAWSGTTTVHGQAALARAPRHALRHVARARRDDAVLERARRRLGHRVHARRGS